MDAVPPIDRTSTTSFSIAYLNGSTDFIVNELLVEAAGVEPAPPQNVNWLMARDFSSELSVNSLPCCQFVVLWSAPESWRHLGDDRSHQPTRSELQALIA